MALGIVEAARHFVTATNLHPILVNFTAALVPASVASDWADRTYKTDGLRGMGWWGLLYATCITPLTVITGWLFWAKDDNGVTGMAIHKWMGSIFVFLLAALFLWRRDFRRRNEAVTTGYLAVAALVVAILIVQGHLGGVQVFSN